MSLFKRQSKDDNVDELVRKRLCQTFMSLASDVVRRQFLEEHPEMLDPFTEALLIEISERQRDPGAAEYLLDVAQRLRRCRENGIPVEFPIDNEPLPHPATEERLVPVVQQLLTAPTLDAMRQVIQTYPELLTDEADRLMQKVSDDRTREAIEPRRLLLLRCREIGVLAAVEEFEAIRASENSNAKLAETMSAFMSLDSPEEQLRYIFSHPELVSAEAINLLTAFIHQSDDPRVASYIAPTRDLLARINSVGIQQVAEELLGSTAHPAKPSPHTRSLDDLLALDERLKSDPSVAPVIIDECKTRLQDGSENAEPRYLVAVLVLLGRAYCELQSGDRNVHLQNAVDAYRNALALIDEDADRERAAKLHLLLASTTTSIEGNNVEPQFVLAASHYSKAIELLGPEHEAYLSAHMNLGCLHLESTGSEFHIEQAIKHFDEVLRCDWAQLLPSLQITLHLNAGAAYLSRICGNRTTNLDLAIKHLDHALLLLGDDDQASKAKVSFNLGRALFLRRDYDSSARAMSLLKVAQTHYEQIADFGAQAAIAVSLAGLIRTNPKLTSHSDLDEAGYLRSAAELLASVSDDDAIHMVCSSLAESYAQAGNWIEVSNSLTRLLETAEEDFQGRAILRGKQESSGRFAFAFGLGSYALAKQGKDEQAVDLLLSGKARLWREALKLRANQPAGVDDEVWAKYSEAAFKIRAEQWEQSHLYDPRDYITSQNAKQAALHAAIKQVQLSEPEFAQTVRTHVLRKHLAPGTCLITAVVTDFGSMAFIVLPEGHESVSHVEIPKFTRERLGRLLNGESDGVDSRKTGWLATYSTEVRHALLKAPADWFEAVDKTLVALGTELIAPIVASIPPSIEKLVVMPAGALALLPWHAAQLDPQTGERLYDRYDISYAASADLYLHTSDPCFSSTEDAVAFAADMDDGSLPFVKEELNLLRQHFPFTGSEEICATRGAVLDASKTASILHFACHGEFCWHDVGKSHLRLADGLITLDELLVGDLLLETIGESEAFLTRSVDFSNVKLAVLAACESGVVDAVRDGGDEYMSLSAGCIVCGANNVISSLWVVDDLSTALLMNAMYSYLGSGMSVSSAVRKASLWLREATAEEIRNEYRFLWNNAELARDIPSWLERLSAAEDKERPFAHPYYWASFVVFSR
ncbi:MAG: CHAT domain-containing protein [Planctomycetota bacterium]